jgi:hypothetical protein
MTPGGVEQYLRTACRPLPASACDREDDVRRRTVVGRSFGIASTDGHRVSGVLEHD